MPLYVSVVKGVKTKNFLLFLFFFLRFFFVGRNVCDVQRAGCSFLLANARIVDFPVVHSSQSFCAMSGFSVNELLHRSSCCSFMHGELTNQATVNRLQETLQNQVEDQMEILLYKKNSNVTRDILKLRLSFRGICSGIEFYVAIICRRNTRSILVDAQTIHKTFEVM